MPTTYTRSPTPEQLEASPTSTPPEVESSPIATEVIDSDWSRATEELLDALPQTWTRGMLYFLMAFVAIALPWAMFYQVEETGAARGRLEPQGGTIKRESDIPGAVAIAKISVKEGEEVTAGQAIAELDSQQARQDLQQAEDKVRGLRQRQAQLEVLQNQLQIARGAQQLQIQAQIAEQQAQVSQTQARITSLQSLYGLESSRLAATQNNTSRYRRLWQQGAVTKQKLEEVEDASTERDKSLAQVVADLVQARAELQKQQHASDRVKQAGEYAIAEAKKQIGDYQAQILSLQAEINQSLVQIRYLQAQLDKYIIRSPIDGVIFKLPASKAGAVVQPKQLIAEIAPQNAPLIFKGQIPTSETESLREGKTHKTAKLKFDDYRIETYGILSGQVQWISPTSTQGQNNEQASFEIEIALEKQCLPAGKNCIALLPGQTATAEVVVRRRRIIDFILDPFKKLQKEGLKL